MQYTGKYVTVMCILATAPGNKLKMHTNHATFNTTTFIAPWSNVEYGFSLVRLVLDYGLFTTYRHKHMFMTVNKNGIVITYQTRG